MVKEHILEEAVRQNWVTKYKIYATGHSAIENYNVSTKKTIRVYLNVKTTNKFVSRFIEDPKWNISGANKITRFLIKIGLVNIDIKRKDNDR